MFTKRFSTKKVYNYRFSKQQLEFAAAWLLEDYEKHVHTLKSTMIDKIQFTKYFIKNVTQFILEQSKDERVLDARTCRRLIYIGRCHPTVKKSLENTKLLKDDDNHSKDLNQNDETFLTLQSDGSITIDNAENIIYPAIVDDEVIDFNSIELQNKFENRTSSVALYQPRTK